MNDIPIINQLPEKLRGWAVILFLALPYVTRAYHALASGGGLRGIWNAVWFGTNTPKSSDQAGNVPVKVLSLLALTAAVAWFLCGCAYLRSTTTTAYEGTNQVIKTSVRSFTLWDSKAELAKFQNRGLMTSSNQWAPGTSIGSVSQSSSSSTNLSNIVEGVAHGVVSALKP